MGKSSVPLRGTWIPFAMVFILGFPSTALAIPENTPQIEWLNQFGAAADDSAKDTTTKLADSPGYPQQLFTVGTVSSALPGQSYAGGIDGVLRKYDSHGTLMWERQFGTSGDDIVTSVMGAPPGGGGESYVAGYTNGLFPGATGHGGIDGFLRKYDDEGNLLWTRQYGTAGTDEFHACAYVQGNIYCGGRTSGALADTTNAGGFDVLLMGIELGDGGPYSIQEVFGTSGDDIVTEVKSAININGFFVAGSVGGTLPDQTSFGGSDLFVRRYTKEGGLEWTKQMGTSGNDDHASVTTLLGAIAVSGSTDAALPGFTNAGGIDGIDFRLDLDGTEIFNHQFGTTGNDIPVNIHANITSPNVIIGGTTTGTFEGQVSSGGTDIFIVKYDVDALQKWAKQFGSVGTDLLRSTEVAISSEIDSGASDIYLAGDTTGNLHGNTNAGGTDAFLAKISQDEDSDNIFNSIDLQPQNVSDDFTDGVTTGTITDRGTQVLTIIDSPDAEVGVKVSADPLSSASDPAEVSLCLNAATATLDPGDEVELKCGSAIIAVTKGEVETTFQSLDGFSATSTYDAGNTLNFAVSANEFTTPETNDDTVTVSVGATDQALAPGTKLVIANATADTFLRKGPPNTNEGANLVLLARKQGDIRSLVLFDGNSISLTGLRKATLVLTINGSNAPDGWSAAGRYLDVQRMTQSWSEGNGKDLDLPEEDVTRGTGDGTTWNCPTDSDISNHQKNCSTEWNGAENATAPRTAPGYLMKNNFTGQATWDVTQDILDGGLAHGWMIKKREENKAGNVRFYSKEGAGTEMNFVPQLLLEYEN